MGDMIIHNCSQEERLDRIDTKLDRVVELLISMARVEERITSLFVTAKDHERRLKVVEGSCRITGFLENWTGKGILAVAAAIAGAVATYYLKGN